MVAAELPEAGLVARGELERIASRPSLETWLQTVRERKAAGGTRIPAKKIVHARDADRK